MALSSIAQVRLAIGDRDTPSILTDDEIQHFLDEAAGIVATAIGGAASALAFYFATKADQTTGRMSVAYSKRADTYRAMAIEFGVGIDDAVAGVFMGGQSQAALSSSREDTDLVQPTFTNDLHEDLGGLP